MWGIILEIAFENPAKYIRTLWTIIELIFKHLQNSKL
jgi:hypothetical protein